MECCAHDSNPLYLTQGLFVMDTKATPSHFPRGKQWQKKGCACVWCVCMYVRGGGGGPLVDEQVSSIRISSPVLSSKGASLKSSQLGRGWIQPALAEWNLPVMENSLCQARALWLESESLALTSEDEGPGPVPTGDSHLLSPLLQCRFRRGLYVLAVVVRAGSWLVCWMRLA